MTVFGHSCAPGFVALAHEEVARRRPQAQLLNHRDEAVMRGTIAPRHGPADLAPWSAYRSQ